MRARAELADAGNPGGHQGLDIRTAAVVLNLICTDRREQGADLAEGLERFRRRTRGR